MKGHMSEHKEKADAASGTGSLQRSTQEGSGRAEENSIKALRQKQLSIKEGHGTGGYCDTEALLEVERQIFKLQSKALAEAKEKHGYSPDPKFKHPDVRRLELEVNGLAYKPKHVVVAD